MNKKELRQHIRALKKAMPREELDRQSKAVCQRVMGTSRWQTARTVLLYAALPDEVDTQLLIVDAVKEGKMVLLPVVVGDVLELREYKGQTQLGAFGIEEPVAEGAPFTDFSTIDLIIVPGMAFDKDGHRLGRGKGFYDKLFAEMLKSVRISSEEKGSMSYKLGICFDFQFVEEVPNELHDIKMDEVITPSYPMQ